MQHGDLENVSNQLRLVTTAHKTLTSAQNEESTDSILHCTQRCIKLLATKLVQTFSGVPP
jgi:hypothetical protein